MQSLKLLNLLFLLALSITANFGCVAASDNCLSQVRELKKLSQKDRTDKFMSFSLEAQYDLYICGMQKIEPPVDLSALLALKGKDIAKLLQAKLALSQSDETASDIIRVFSQIQMVKTYDLKKLTMN